MRTPEKDKISKLLNKKVLLGLLSIIMCMGLIIVCSFTAFIIDPSRWQTTEFLTDELIIVAIVILAMISFIFIAQSSNAQDERSNLAKSRAKFFASKSLVDQRGTNIFRQWIKKCLQPEDIIAIKERKIRALGIDDISVLELEKTEIIALINTPQKYNNKFYKSLTEEQANAIIKIKESKFKMKFVEPEYYLSVKNLTDSRTVSERAADEGKKKGIFMTYKITGRIIVTLVSAVIFASLVRDMTQDVDQAAAWAKFMSRMWALISSSFMGFLVGVQMNDIDAEYIEMRVEVHTRFLEDKDFKGMTQQEEAKEEFINRVKEEQVLLLDSKDDVKGE